MLSTVQRKAINRWRKITRVLLYPELDPAFRAFSHLTDEERIALYRLVENLVPTAETIIEIGSYLGVSACCFGASMKKRGKGQIFCIDTWSNDAMTEGKRDTFAEFSKNTRKFKPLIHPLRGWSTEVVSQIPVDHTDVLFIDGDHSYESVKADWEAYKRFLRPGSLVIFHDIGWAVGVQGVVRDDVTPLCENVGTLPNLWWGTYSSNAASASTVDA